MKAGPAGGAGLLQGVAAAPQRATTFFAGADAAGCTATT